MRQSAPSPLRGGGGNTHECMLLTGLSGLLGIDIPSFTGHAPGSLVMEALAFFFLRQGLKSAGNI